MTWQWHAVQTGEAAEYVRRLRENQPQYHTSRKVVAEHIAIRPGYARYYLGENERGDKACFRLLLLATPPIIDQYGADGPNWLTAFARGISAVCERMDAIAPELSKELNRTIPPYDIAEIIVKTDDLKDRAAGLLLAYELEKRAAGPTVVTVQPRGHSETHRRYRMIRVEE